MQGPLDSLALLLPWALAAASLGAVKFGSLRAYCLSGSALCVCAQGVQMQTDDKFLGKIWTLRGRHIAIIMHFVKQCVLDRLVPGTSQGLHCMCDLPFTI